MKSKLAKWILRRWGFELVGEKPTQLHSVMVASPHTSNWDFPLALLIGWALEFNMRWLGKKEMFPPVIGALWKRLGGIPVDRKAAGSMVDDMVGLFQPGERITIVIPVSGTRGYTPHWKSGFYRIARAADVPVIPAFVDYTKKICGAGPAIELSGDVTADMDLFRAFYAEIEGKYPDDDGPVVLREELESATAPAEVAAGQDDPANVIGMAQLLDLQAAKTLVDSPPENLVILDVRTGDEFAAGHVDGAINIDIYDDAFADKVGALDDGVPYLVYCKAGGRSAKACEVMTSIGFADLSDMTNGWDGWSAAGY